MKNYSDLCKEQKRQYEEALPGHQEDHMDEVGDYQPIQKAQ